MKKLNSVHIGLAELWLNFLLRNTVIVACLYAQLAFPVYLAGRYLFGAFVLGSIQRSRGGGIITE